MSKPNKIYKYEPMSIQALANLKSESIYFNSPKNFNDPFDCNMALRVSAPYVDEIPHIKEFLIEEAQGKGAVEEIENLSEGDIAAMGMVLAEKYMKNRKSWAFDSYGICCFSETNDNLLMWSHYASSGKGFCLEFDSSCEPFDKIQPVKYVDEPPPLNFKKVFTVDQMYLLDALFCTKSVHWSYEKEWRTFHQDENKIANYPTASLTGVYFGPEVEDTFAEIICLILQGQHPDIIFYKGVRSEESYKVDFTEVTYTSSILKSA